MRIFMMYLMFVAMLTTGLWAQIGTPQMVQGIPACHAFAGESAMKWEGNTLHFTYLYTLGDYTYGAYVRVTENGTPEVYTVDVNHHDVYFNVMYDIFAPSLAVTDQQVIIAYRKQYAQMLAVSPREPINFTLQEVMSSQDDHPLPIVRDGQAEVYLAKGDSAYNGDYQVYNRSAYSTNAGYSFYWGPDIVYGKVRVNGRLVIKQAGGGENNGWPIFLDHVYTSSSVESNSGAYPVDQVFRGGLTEFAPVLEPDADAQTYMLEQAPLMFPDAQGEDHIIFLTVTGSTYQAMIGTITAETFHQVPVFSTYPPPTGTELYINTFATRDTIWVAAPGGTLPDGIIKINAPLWIRGSFSGNNIIYSPYKIMLSGDITLSGTPAGQTPDDNSSDFVTLVSGERIEIQYGYRDPTDGLRYHPNCRADDNPLHIYANLVTLKQDPMSQKEGTFTFEYQHPHPSIPDVTLDGNEYTWIDLHRRRFPQTPANPWPPLIDYPWYNPLWPERVPYLERGTIRHYGSAYQSRSGYMHRSTMILNGPTTASGTLSWTIAAVTVARPQSVILTRCLGSSSPTRTTQELPVAVSDTRSSALETHAAQTGEIITIPWDWDCISSASTPKTNGIWTITRC